MRVLAIGHSYIVKSNRAILKSLVKRKSVSLKLVVPNYFVGDHGPIKFQLDSTCGFPIFPLEIGFKKSKHLFYYRGLKHFIREHQFDVIHCWEEPYILAGYQVARLAKKFQIPFAFWSNQNLPKSYPPPFNHFETFCVSQADAWQAVGFKTYQNLVERGYPSEKGSLLPIAIDKDLFHVDARSRVIEREKLGLHKFTIGYCGRLEPQKGIQYLIQALDTLEGHWQFLCVGTGSLERSVLNWASRKKNKNKVRFISTSPDHVARYLRCMDVLVAPSLTTPRWKEQFGRVLVEAFACRVPIIATDSGEIPYVIGDAGKLVPEQNAEALNAALKQLMTSDEQRKRFAILGMERYKKRYSSEAISRLLFQSLNSMLKHRKSLQQKWNIAPHQATLSRCYNALI